MSSAGFHKFKDVSLDRIGPLWFRVKEDIMVKVNGEKATRPIVKRVYSLDGAMAYAKSALETYSWAKVEIVPIDEPLYKFSVTISKK